jgi:hypothetical protein
MEIRAQSLLPRGIRTVRAITNSQRRGKCAVAVRTRILMDLIYVAELFATIISTIMSTSQYGIGLHLSLVTVVWCEETFYTH